MNEREKQFCEELKALLEKYGVELSASDEYKGYPECGEDIRIMAYASSVWKDAEIVADSIDIDFGKYINEASIQFS